MRLFGRLLKLDELGLGAQVLADVTRALDAKTGLLLVAGSTGAGKTTTLLYRLRKPDKKGRSVLVLTPLQLLARLAAILPAVLRQNWIRSRNRGRNGQRGR